MFRKCAFLLLCCTMGVFAKYVEEGRVFGNRYTKTVVKPHVVTTLVPSSCIQVDASLPPCRMVRSFGSFPSLGAKSNEQSNSKNVTQPLKEPVIETTPLSWGEYLGFVAPTVTITATQVITTTKLDPRVTVTFSLKGCRPSLLPLGLDRCPIEPEKPESILPTSTVQAIQPTVSVASVSSNNIETESTVSSRVTVTSTVSTTPQLEGSTSSLVESTTASVKPTTSLDSGRAGLNG